jgi:hypothetical protein
MKVTLYSLAINIRRFLVGFLIFAVIVVALDFIGKLFTSEEGFFAPTTTIWQDIPLNGFGVNLPFPEIESLAISKDSKPVYSLRDDFGIFPDTALVYQVNKPREKLDSADRAKNIAERLGFEPNEFKNEQGLLTWENPRRTRRLTHHLVNRTWNFETVTYFQDENAIRTKVTDKESTKYPQLIRSVIGQLDFTSSSLTSGEVQTAFVTRTATGFAPVTFTQNAEYVVGNVFRKLIMSSVKPDEELKDEQGQPIRDFSAKVYTRKPEEGSLSLVVADDVEDLSKDMYEFKFTDFEYTANSSYYHLISPTLAWQGVQTGKGRLMSLIPQNKSRFEDYTIADVDRFIAEATQTELAYYEPEEWTGYIYPVYIFRGIAQLRTGGTASFVFYIDAMRR